ncbi:uncharacterized protein LOC116193180 isoform X2 [Punica granatum]|nr:uncharacterized protein LOC116193180 isoform X2 [Punica granatum]
MDGKAAEARPRQIHIIYSLSRGGHIDQRHLFRVHQVSHTGVYLRDIKRWLADLPGKDMPEALSWSYKRRYRTGYIWQDLVDDDLLTPISDNEYVLQGSEKISSPSMTPNYVCSSSCDSSSSIDGKNQPAEAEADAEPEPESNNPGAAVGPTVEFGLQQQSPLPGSESSTLTDVSLKNEPEEVQQEKPPSLEYTVTTDYRLETRNSSFNFNLSSENKKKKKKQDKKKRQHDQVYIERYNAVPVGAASSAQSTFTKTKKCSGGAALMFRNLISCGAIDTKDAFLVMPNRPVDKPASPGPPKVHEDQPRDARKSFERFNSRTWKNRSEKQMNSSSKKLVSTAHKPVSVPCCSQCGKSFKPEKLHNHMKSCRGMKLALSRKGLAPMAATPEKKFSPVFVDAPLGDPAPASLLTYNR